MSSQLKLAPMGVTQSSSTFVIWGRQANAPLPSCVPSSERGKNRTHLPLGSV